jgi:hypothetical protein
MKSSMFWDITLCSLLKFNRRFGGTCLRSSETSVRFQQTTRRYSQEDKTLHRISCSNPSLGMDADLRQDFFMSFCPE